MNLPAPLILALDVPTSDEAQRWVARLSPRVGIYKIGMQLFYEAGPDVVRRIQGQGGQVFLDLKLHDIPHTVARAVESLLPLNVRFLTVHTSGGLDMLQAAQSAAAGSQLQLLGVTALTSLNENQLRQILPGSTVSVSQWALSLGKLAQEAGLYGLVCSAHENDMFRQALGDTMGLVNPGIRPSGSALNDQQRVMTPAQAMAAGANYLVIGRPILTADQPEALVESILQEMGYCESRLSS